MVTVQGVLLPTESLVTVQVREDKTGVVHRAKLTVWEDVPNVAVTAPVVSVVMLPTAALNDWAELAAGTRILAGTVMRADVELNVTVVSVGAGCESVAVQILVAPESVLLGLQKSELTRTGAMSGTVAVLEDEL
jgi:hypothetical protein